MKTKPIKRTALALLMLIVVAVMLVAALNYNNRTSTLDLSFVAEWLEVFPMEGSVGVSPSSPDFVAPTIDGEVDLLEATALFRIYLAFYMGMDLEIFLNGAYDEWHSSMMASLEGNPEAGFAYNFTDHYDRPEPTSEMARWGVIWSIVNDPLFYLSPMGLYVSDVFVERTHTFERLDKHIYSTLGYESFEAFMAYLINDFDGLLFLYEVTNAGRAGLTISMVLRASINNHMDHEWQLLLLN